MLEPRRLRLLVELADRGTITAAARALHFTPSTVSHGLSMLERDLGVALLERSPRSVRLTAAGEALAREGRLALRRLSAAETDARAVGRLDGGEVAIATFPSAGPTIAVEAFRLLSERHPAARVRLRHAEPEEALPRLVGGELDVAVIYTYPYLPMPDLDGLEAVRLLDDPMKICLPPDDPLAGGDAVPVGALSDRPFIAGGEGSTCAQFARAVCREAGFEPRIAFETEDMPFTCALVNAGAGVAIMPELLIGTAGRPVCRRELAPAVPPRVIWAVHRSSATNLPSVRAAMDALTKAAPRARASER